LTRFVCSPYALQYMRPMGGGHSQNVELDLANLALNSVGAPPP
jgi:hypothetical protein